MTGLGFNGNITSAAATSFTTAGTISAVLATGTGTTANVTITGTVSNTVDAPLTTASDVTITIAVSAGSVLVRAVATASSANRQQTLAITLR